MAQAQIHQAIRKSAWRQCSINILLCRMLVLLQTDKFFLDLTIAFICRGQLAQWKSICFINFCLNGTPFNLHTRQDFFKCDKMNSHNAWLQVFEKCGFINMQPTKVESCRRTKKTLWVKGNVAWTNWLSDFERWIRIHYYTTLQPRLQPKTISAIKINQRWFSCNDCNRPQ